MSDALLARPDGETQTSSPGATSAILATARRPSPARSTGSQTSLVRPPKSPRRSQGSPLLSTSSSLLAPPTPSKPTPPSLTSTALARPAELERVQSSTSTASRPSLAPSNPSSLDPETPHILPSHPAALPNMYDSTASMTDDADGEHDSAADEGTNAGAALLAERRRREEVRAARRSSKQDAAGARTKLVRDGSAQGQSMAVRETTRDVSHALGLRPLVDGRNGLGFAFIEAEADATVGMFRPLALTSVAH
ncbi:hypothetical protein JCM3770_001660 [Rhodotorula araucariae]